LVVQQAGESDRIARLLPCQVFSGTRRALT
jgi:hypothetical protein